MKLWSSTGSTATVRGLTEITAGSLLDDDQWHDVVITRDKQNMRVVVDRLVNENKTAGLFYRLDLDKFVRDFFLLELQFCKRRVYLISKNNIL